MTAFGIGLATHNDASLAWAVGLLVLLDKKVGVIVLVSSVLYPPEPTLARDACLDTSTLMCCPHIYKHSRIMLLTLLLLMFPRR